MPFDTSGDMPERGGTLALDLAGITGWCYGMPGRNRPPLFGRIILHREHGEPGRYASFDNELERLMERFRPARMVLEATIPLQAMNNYTAAAQAFGLRSLALMWAYRFSCSKHEVDCWTVRARFGIRRCPSDRAKREVMRVCYRDLGWKVPDHNAGDACLTWKFFTDNISGVNGPLFEERVY